MVQTLASLELIEHLQIRCSILQRFARPFHRHKALVSASAFVYDRVSTLTHDNVVSTFDVTSQGE
jgi:hypothetical protein